MKEILHNVSGMAESGKLLAIMGSSGAGKTTLLNVLTSRNLTNLDVQGSILVDGKRANKWKIREVRGAVSVQTEPFPRCLPSCSNTTCSSAQWPPESTCNSWLVSGWAITTRSTNGSSESNKFSLRWAFRSVRTLWSEYPTSWRACRVERRSGCRSLRRFWRVLRFCSVMSPRRVWMRLWQVCDRETEFSGAFRISCLIRTSFFPRSRGASTPPVSW